MQKAVPPIPHTAPWCSVQLGIEELLHLPCICMKAQYLFNRWLGGPQCLSRQFGAEKNLLHLPGIEPRFLSRQAHSLVPIPTMLSCLPHC